MKNYEFRKAILIVFFLLVIGVWKDKEIYENVEKMKNKIASGIEYQRMNEKNTDLSKWESYCLEDEENAWYTKYHFISHAGGGIDGHIYTNSLEAWENSYKNGNRVFDADLNFTSDGMLVLRHSWKDHLEQGALISADGKMKIDRNGECRVVDYTAKQMSFEEFKNTKIFVTVQNPFGFNNQSLCKTEN